MLNNHAIGVIVPIYKVEAYLSRCIDSILAQTFTDFELILVDDGSPDNCPAICDEYAAKDKRIRVIHQENGGLSAARNSGIDASSGEYLTFIDSDDWVHEKFLEVLYNGIREYGVLISMCELQSVYDDSEPVPVLYAPPTVIDSRELVKMAYSIFSMRNNVPTCSKLYHRKLFEKVRFPVGKIHEDTFTTYKLLEQCDKIACYTGKYYYYYMRSTSIMHSTYSVRNLDANEAMSEAIEHYKNDPEMAHHIRKSYAFQLAFHSIKVREILGDRKRAKALKKESIALLDEMKKRPDGTILDYTLKEAYKLDYPRFIYKMKYLKALDKYRRSLNCSYKDNRVFDDYSEVFPWNTKYGVLCWFFIELKERFFNKFDS